MLNYRLLVISLLTTCFLSTAQAGIITFNSSSPANNETTRTAWLNAVGVTAPQYLVDFESGFSDGQNISGVGGLFPAGLVISDVPDGNAIIESGSIGGSNPVGNFALEQDESPVLRLDFSSFLVDYVAFQDIDHTNVSILITFEGGGTASTSLETTATGGDSAEFFGVFRNDMPRILYIDMDAAGDRQWAIDNIEYGVLPVPVPAAVWLFGSGLLGLVGAARRRL